VARSPSDLAFRDDMLGAIVFIAAVGIAVVAALAIFSSCATIEAVAAAPEEFWISLDAIVAALFEDIWSLVRLFI
jgi:hypothetical protein